MFNLRRKTARVLGAALVAASGAGLASVLVSASTVPAHADPAFAGSEAGVGSDTIQDVLDAYTGTDPYSPASNAAFYTPIHSDSASNNVVVSSWDAIPAGGASGTPYCVTTKLGGNSFDRPNGSGNGVSALRSSIDGTTYTETGNPTCAGPQPTVGQIDFARSSSGVSDTSANVMTWIPAFRDGLTYAFYTKGPLADVSAISSLNLKTLYNAGPGNITIGSTKIFACAVQSGSGTLKTFEKFLGVSDNSLSQAVTASTCPRTEEHGGDAFVGSSFVSGLGANQAAVIQFSAAQYIMQANGKGVDRSSAARALGTNTFDLGNIDGLASVACGKPYCGSAPNLSADQPYYASKWGRDTYIVVPSRSLTGLNADAGLISLFANTNPTDPTLAANTAVVCQTSAQATASQFGFRTPDTANSGGHYCGQAGFTATVPAITGRA